MHISDRKKWWWLLLGSCVGVTLVFLLVIVATATHSNFLGHDLARAIILCCIEGSLATLAIFELRKCYREKPSYWTGAWQFSLSDMICIVLFFGLVMLVVRTAGDGQLAAPGIVFSMILGIGYAISLLVVAARDHGTTAIERWILAFFSLFGALTYIATGVLVQIIVLSLIFHVARF